MNSEDSRNLILAIVLSLAVLIGWNYFYGAPQLQKDRQAQTQANAPASAGQTGNSSASLPQGAAPPVAQIKPRADALAASKRIPIDTRSLGGSINLTGGLID